MEKKYRIRVSNGTASYVCPKEGGYVCQHEAQAIADEIYRVHLFHYGPGKGIRATVEEVVTLEPVSVLSDLGHKLINSTP